MWVGYRLRPPPFSFAVVDLKPKSGTSGGDLTHCLIVVVTEENGLHLLISNELSPEIIGI
jgi:hypothetical protein